MCVCLATLFALSKHKPERYVEFRAKMDGKVWNINQNVYKYTHANQSLYRHQISQTGRRLTISFLKKVYIGLQYVIRFIRRNIIMTAKKVNENEPNKMLQELRKERDRIMDERGR